jgi:hypothetical protein
MRRRSMTRDAMLNRFGTVKKRILPGFSSLGSSFEHSSTRSE